MTTLLIDSLINPLSGFEGHVAPDRNPGTGYNRAFNISRRQQERYENNNEILLSSFVTSKYRKR